MIRRLALLVLLTVSFSAFAADFELPAFPEPQEGELVFTPPSLDSVPEGPLGDMIRYGYDLFVNTQQLRGVNTFSDLDCVSCHLDGGAMPFSAPIWPAAVTLPDYRGKNWRINTLEERISDCFAYSMNGIAPAQNSDEMNALLAYHTWMATGAPMYPDEPIYGRGYGDLADPEHEPDYARGELVYAEQCALCHGVDGQGQKVNGEVVFPPLWGDYSYNWGAGMSRMPNFAKFVKTNMPLGLPLTLTDQEAWDVAQFVNSHERPQDPRYTGDVAETLERHAAFHSASMYGQEVNGVILGDHDNTGEKPFLRPESLRYAPLTDDE